MGIFNADLHQTFTQPADDLFGNHSTKSRARFRSRQYQSAVRGIGARTVTTRESVISTAQLARAGRRPSQSTKGGEKTMTPSTETATLAKWVQKVKRSQLQEMLFAAAKPGIISFAMGLPAAELFPAEGLSRAASYVLANDSRALQYGPPFQPLKSQIVQMM